MAQIAGEHGKSVGHGDACYGDVAKSNGLTGGPCTILQKTGGPGSGNVQWQDAPGEGIQNGFQPFLKRICPSKCARSSKFRDAAYHLGHRHGRQVERCCVSVQPFNQRPVRIAAQNRRQYRHDIGVEQVASQRSISRIGVWSRSGKSLSSTGQAISRRAKEGAVESRFHSS